MAILPAEPEAPVVAEGAAGAVVSVAAAGAVVSVAAAGAVVSVAAATGADVAVEAGNGVAVDVPPQADKSIVAPISNAISEVLRFLITFLQCIDLLRR
jgi:hypothetical protein